MRFFYNIFFNIIFVLIAPYYYWRLRRRGNWKSGFGQRFGRYSAKIKQAITNRHTLWFHAVSVGEVNVCTQLIRALEPRLPNLKIVVSTTTTTGMGELNRKLPSHIQKIYYPIDRRAYVHKALATIHPEAVVLVEAEIWPNFLWRADHMGIPVILVNARLSERSYRGYKKYGFLFRSIFYSLASVGCQNEADGKRLLALGCHPEAVQVVGNLKFDAAKLDERRVVDVPRLLRQLAVTDAPVLVAGSTHAGEEAALGEVYLRLKEKYPDLFLVVVPRHFERGGEAGRDLKRKGVKFLYRSDLSVSTDHKEREVDCLVVNTTGELKYFYECATVIFVGKSLTAKGGQNPIEPGVLGKAMVFGPNMQNFAAVARSFVEAGGAVQVQDVEELESVLGDLIGDPERLKKLGEQALAVVRENLGAIERTVEMILGHIDEDEVYVTDGRPPGQ